MISIKINCACGQRYAFDVEPVQGLMPHAVACPVCNADGTDSANAMIAQAAAPVSIAPAPSGGLRLRGANAESSTPVAATAASTTAAPSRHAPLLPGQISRDQAFSEARAKMMWGTNLNRSSSS